MHPDCFDFQMNKTEASKSIEKTQFMNGSSEQVFNSSKSFSNIKKLQQDDLKNGKDKVLQPEM